MAATAVDIGFGASVTFQSGLLAKITRIAPAGMAREARETSHMSSTNGWRTFLPTDLKDPGEITVELLFDKNVAAIKTAIAAAGETITVGYPVPAGGSTGGSHACSGFLTSIEYDVPMDEVMTAVAVLKLTGEPTMTDGT